MTSTQYINLDLTTPYRQVIYSKTGDTNRYAQITLYNDGVAWDVPSGAVGKCYAEDLYGNYYSANSVSFSDNVVTALLPTITQMGTASCEVEISVGGQVVTTFNFYVEVYQSA